VRFEEDRLGNKGRREYLRAIYDRYQQVGRKNKKVIVSEFCANMGYHRKYVIRLLNGEQPEKRPRPPRRRGVSYGSETLAVLTAAWKAAGYPLVGTAEGAAAVLDAVDPQALSFAAGSRKGVAENQSATDGPVAESGQDTEATAHLRAHQTGVIWSSTRFR
jgi:hypothetical protein